MWTLLVPSRSRLTAAPLVCILLVPAFTASASEVVWSLLSVPIAPAWEAAADHRNGIDTAPSECPAQARAANTDTTGAWEVHLSFNGMSFFARSMAGIAVESTYRWPGPTGRPDGHFSIGFQADFWPSAGRWSQVPFDIATITDFRLNNFLGEDGTIRFGNQEVEPHELFLLGKGNADIQLTGSFYVNPLNNDLFRYTRTRIRNMHTWMGGIHVPMRWYFGEQRSGHPRWFVSTNIGIDVLFVAADYEVITTSVTYVPGSNTIAFTRSSEMEKEPLGGEVSKNILFSNAGAGGGVAFGRFMISCQGHFLFTKEYSYKGTDYDRVRGNLLVVPILAGATDDPEIASTLAQGGIVPFGRTDITRTSNEGTSTDSANLAKGVSRFWDRSYWTLGLSFQLR